MSAQGPGLQAQAPMPWARSPGPIGVLMPELLEFEEPIGVLMKEVEAKTFRLDLYHRLSVILIHVPSLNERRDDIPQLIDRFLDDICDDYGIAKKQISDDAIKLLQENNWTGNIRELRNVVERLVILSGKGITKEDVRSYVHI